MNSLSVGDILENRFEILEIRPPGGMSYIYKAIDKESKKLCAIKIAKQDGDQELCLLAFEREDKALDSLNHENIIKKIDSGKSPNGGRYIALEWIESNLKEKLETNKKISWESFYSDLGRPLLNALYYAHNRNIAHRDIKPENILMNDVGYPIVADFGIARANNSIGLGLTFRHAGSPPYTPPEPDDGTWSFGRDVFSWGVIATSCLTGKTFADYSEIHTALSELDVKKYPIRSLSRAISLDPKERHINAGELLVEMDEFHRSYVAESGKKLNVNIEIGPNFIETILRHHPELDAKEVKEWLESDLNNILSGQLTLDEDEIELYIIGSTTEATMRLEPIYKDRFRVTTLRCLTLDRAEKHRNDAFTFEFTKFNFGILNPSLNNQSTVREFLTRVRALEDDRKRELERRSRERWFDCWAAFLREKERFYKEKRIKVRYKKLDRKENLYVATCEGDILEGQIGSSLVIHSQSGRQLVFDIKDISGDQIFMELKGGQHHLVPFHEGYLESNFASQLQTITRQRTALEMIRRNRAVSPIIGQLLCDPSKSYTPERSGLSNPPKSLSTDKLDILDRAIGVNGFLAIEGPPGTGKTTLIAEIISIYLNRFPNKRILLSSQTHVALDHVIKKLMDKGLNDQIVRVHGESIEKIDDEVLPLTLERKANRWCEMAEERARKFLSLKAKSIGLNHEEVEAAILANQLFLLRISTRDLTNHYAEISSNLKNVGNPKNDFESIESPDLTLLKTSTVLDEQARVLEQLQSNKRADKRLSAKLETLGHFGNELVTSNLNDMEEWINALMPPATEHGKRFRQLAELQKGWLERLGATRDFYPAILGEAQIVAGTCIGVGNIQAIYEDEYDLCIVDEVSKATATESLVPICRSKNWILVGDPKQLPPFFETDNYESIEGFAKEEVKSTLFDILLSTLPNDCKGSLVEQRRMVRGIGDLISHIFYIDKLVTIRQLNERIPAVSASFPKPVTWVTTSKLKPKEQEQPGLTYRNLTECNIVIDLLVKLNKAKAKSANPIKVAAIAGYSAQVAALKNIIGNHIGGFPNLSIEVNTVDAFQGRDADVCIYSVTRSNPHFKLGFQKEKPRLNVALSRGRDSLIIVGDDNFCRGIVKNNPFLPVLDYIDSNPELCEVRQP
jgi:superfamily I DNA and/or RNA helicase/serine/threonine protein kinase